MRGVIRETKGILKKESEVVRGKRSLSTLVIVNAPDTDVIAPPDHAGEFLLGPLPRVEVVRDGLVNFPPRTTAHYDVLRSRRSLQVGEKQSRNQAGR